MPTQKVFKQRVRARMSKTGESYTTSRLQLLRRATDEAEHGHDPVPDQAAAADVPAEVMLVAEEAMVRATGKGHAEWFAILDGWGATDHRHTEIARWLRETQATPDWWTQNITVAYERARGMRARHQMADGFEVNVSRTIDVPEDRTLAAFTDAAVRERWLPGAPITARPSRAKWTARFDWTDPESRVVVVAAPKGDGRTIVSVAHGRLPDAETGERLKAAWRGWLGDLKATLEQD